MLEKVHRKILRTIQGLPLRCHSRALLHLTGTPCIASLIHLRQLNFLRAFSALPLDSLPRQVLVTRLCSSPTKGSLPVFCSLLGLHNLPPLLEIISGSWSKAAWSKWLKGLLSSLDYSAFLDDRSHLPVSDCPFTLGKPLPHWSITRGLPSLTRMNNFRIRLLVGCDGLEADASRFRYRSRSGAPVNCAICKLCMLEAEDVSHFLTRCPALDSSRRSLLLSIPSFPINMVRLLDSDSARLMNLILGVEWIDDDVFQHAVVVFLYSLRLRRNALLTTE